MSRQGRAYGYGLGAVLLWSTVATAFKLTLARMDHLQLLMWASVFSLMALLAVLAAGGGLARLFTCTRRQYLRSALFGFMNPFLYYLVLFKAYDLLPAQEAQPLNYTWAITLALLSIPLLKQKISRFDLGAALVSYAGVLVISTHGDLAGFTFTNGPGVSLALGSTIIWALYWIFNTSDDRDPVVGLALNFAFGLPWVIGACLLFSNPLAVDWQGLGGAAYVGFFEMGFTFVLWLAALKNSANTAKVGNLIFLSPFLSLVFIHFFVGEEILPSTYVGLCLIMAGLAVQRLGRSRAE